MTVEDDSGRILAVRFLIGASIMVLILYTTAIWSTVSITEPIRWYIWLVETVSIALLLMFLVSRASIPESLQKRSVEYYIEELLHQDKVFVIPTICTQCRTPIELNKVRWEDEYTLHCQECQAEIKLRVIEESEKQ